MGSMNLPQGPNRHCGLKDGHPMHSNLTPVDGTWCDGLPPLRPFVELTVRVALEGDFDCCGAPHEAVLEAILDEWGSFLTDNVGDPEARTVLRLRQGGKDQVYPLQMLNGALVVKDDTGD